LVKNELNGLATVELSDMIIGPRDPKVLQERGGAAQNGRGKEERDSEYVSEYCE
jgi:hypothetical protein